jgi:hypothetical protein
METTDTIQVKDNEYGGGMMGKIKGKTGIPEGQQKEVGGPQQCLGSREKAESQPGLMEWCYLTPAGGLGGQDKFRWSTLTESLARCLEVLCETCHSSCFPHRKTEVTWRNQTVCVGM